MLQPIIYFFTCHHYWWLHDPIFDSLHSPVIKCQTDRNHQSQCFTFDEPLFVRKYLHASVSFSLHLLHRKYMDGLTTRCDGNSLTDALHFWCFIIFLKSMQSRRFAPLFTSPWRHRLERLFSSCNIDWLKMPCTMCSISSGLQVRCNC